jgi:hypothetical protein
MGDAMSYVKPTVIETPASPTRPPGRSMVGRFVGYCLALLLAAALFAAYEHFKLHGQSTASWVSLIAAALLALLPIRALLHELFALEGKVLHLFHGIGGLLLIALPLSGLVSGGRVLNHAALAPFAIMGAAQAIMHQDHPRNAQQAEALRRFATALPEVAQFTSGRDLSSPANVARAVSVLNDLLTKAQALGETELAADPAFQSALKRVSTRVGLGLGLDSIEHTIDVMAANPAAAGAAPALRKHLLAVRQAVAADPK